MTKVHFEGDWTPQEIQQYTNLLKFGMGEGEGASDTVQTSITGGLLSARQKELLKLFRQSVEAGRKACSEGVHCEPEQLSDDLQKAFIGQVKYGGKGQVYRFNQKHRWVRDRGISSSQSQGSHDPIAGFHFFPEDGEFGQGVYFPVADRVGEGMRIRVHLNLKPEQLISEKRFEELEDFTIPLSVQLDRENVKAIARRGSKGVDLLFLRDPNDIEVLGAVEGSGGLPPNINAIEYRLVWLDEGDPLTAELEVAAVDETESLQKALFSESRLKSDTKKAYAPKIPKAGIREAVERCRKDDIPVDQVQIEVVDRFPDYLPNCLAFCYPQENKIYLVNHDPIEQIHKRQQMLIHQLNPAVEAGVVEPNAAMDAIARAGKIDENWWLEGLIKHYIGIYLTCRICNPLTATDFSKLQNYLQFLPDRGIEMKRQDIARCIGEDYRCAHDPFGLPNLESAIADLAIPELGAIAQQSLINILHE